MGNSSWFFGLSALEERYCVSDGHSQGISQPSLSHTLYLQGGFFCCLSKGTPGVSWMLNSSESEVDVVVTVSDDYFHQRDKSGELGHWNSSWRQAAGLALFCDQLCVHAVGHAKFK